MPRVRRRPPKRRREIDPTERAILLGEPLPDPAQEFFLTENQIRDAWSFCGADLVAEWVALRPGTRPPGWWRLEAPGPRLRLGGVGTPADEASAVLQQLDRGVPVHFVEPWMVESGFRGSAIDPEDPPLYESEAAYLRRLGLLLPGEEARIGATDFNPIPTLTGDLM